MNETCGTRWKWWRSLFRNFFWHKWTENLKITKFPNTISSGKILYRYLFFPNSLNEWVLITTCKQLVWSTWIVRNIPIWILLSGHLLLCTVRISDTMEFAMKGIFLSCPDASKTRQTCMNTSDAASILRIGLLLVLCHPSPMKQDPISL
jgi:hypothetical protein